MSSYAILGSGRARLIMRGQGIRQHQLGSSGTRNQPHHPLPVVPPLASVRAGWAWQADVCTFYVVRLTNAVHRLTGHFERQSEDALCVNTSRCIDIRGGWPPW